MTAMIRLIPESYPGAELYLPLGSEIPTHVPGSGIAKWNSVNRRRRRNGLEFDSEDPVKVTFSVIFDGWKNDVSVIEPWQRMFGWGSRNGLPSMPTVIRTEGPIPFSNLRWVIDNIEQLEARQRESDWALTYMEAKLTLAEWNDLDLIVQNSAATPAASPAAAAQERQSSGSSKLAIAYGGDRSPTATNPQPRTYTVKSGDTLSKIAARELGNANRYKDIASLNGIRDPNKVNVGQVLKLPAT